MAAPSGLAFAPLIPPHDLDCCLDRAAFLTQEGSSVIL
jgi:hypothetical protein